MIKEALVLAVVLASVCYGRSDERKSRHSPPSMDIFRWSSRQRRGLPPTRPPLTCTVTKAELDELSLEIAKISNGTYQSQGNFNSVVTTGTLSRSQCPQLADIKTSIQKIASYVINITSNSVTSVNQASLVSSYEAEITNLKTKLQNVENEANQIFKGQISNLRIILDAKLLENTRLSEVIRKQNTEIRDKNINLCVQYIGNENFSGCKKFLESELSDLEDISIIVERAQNQLSEEKLIHIAQFIYELKTVQKTSAGAIKLFNVMSQKSTLENPGILALKYGLSQYTNFNDIISKLNAPVTKILDAWSNLIRNGQTEAIINFARINDFAKQTISFYLCDLLGRAYQLNRHTFKNILQFSKNLPWGTQTQLAHKCLWTRMESNNHVISSETFLLAYQVKMSLKNKVYDDHYVHNRLPNCAKKIIFEESVHLKNTVHGQYLLSPGAKFAHDSDRLNVYLWRTGDRDDDTKWIITSTDEGQTFYIKSNRHSEYLYAANDYFREGNYRKVFTWRNREKSDLKTFRWYIEPRNSDEIMLKNEEYGQYLFGAGGTRNKDYREVFLWNPGNQISNGNWEVVTP